MAVEICAVGGWGEVGRNMTAVQVDDAVVLFDMGLHMPNYIKLTEEELGEWVKLDEASLKRANAVPQDGILKDWLDKVVAIVLSHAHLDHVGAAPYLAAKYNAPIICTPFTAAVLQAICRDEKIKMPNKIIALEPGSKTTLADGLVLELCDITHSTPQTVLCTLHTKYGSIVYANDFKLDDHPTMGKKPNYEHFKKLGEKGVLALITDCLYSPQESKTPCETVAKEMLHDVLLGIDSRGKAVIVTTFASHIARLKSIAEFGRKLGRKVVFMSRSIAKYCYAAEEAGIAWLSKEAQIIKYGRQIQRKLKQVMAHGKEKYLLVVSGHQGEPKSALSRMADKVLPFRFSPEDIVVFASSVIPAKINQKNREILEEKLKGFGVRLFKDVHVSVMPDTHVVVNDDRSMQIKAISDIDKKSKLRTAAFDPNDLKIKWYNAELIKHKYKGKIYSIKTKSGRSVDITKGHSAFILENGSIRTIEGSKLRIGDYVAIPKSFSWDKELKHIDMRDYIEFSPSKFANYNKDKNWIYYAKRKICPTRTKLNRSFARLLGYYLAEGSAPRHLSLVFNKNEKDLIKEVVGAIKHVFPCEAKVNKRSSALEVCFGARILKRVFKKWFGPNAGNKKIPDFVFSASENFKLNFLGAYINGDGSIDKGSNHRRIRLKTASKKLASDLLYLFSQVGICAKLDHETVIPKKCINKYLAKESRCYVIRIQGMDGLAKIYKYLSSKFKSQLKELLFVKRRKPYLTLPPEALPLLKLNTNEIIPKKNTNFEYILKHLDKRHFPNHINPRIIKRDSVKFTGNVKKILAGDLLFDPITKIKTYNYDGFVYDLRVPGAENFIGGFGGIMLHNSGHVFKEDLREFITMLKPRHLLPTHGEQHMVEAFGRLATEMGYPAETVHPLANGQRLKL